MPDDNNDERSMAQPPAIVPGVTLLSAAGTSSVPEAIPRDALEDHFKTPRAVRCSSSTSHSTGRTSGAT